MNALRMILESFLSRKYAVRWCCHQLLTTCMKPHLVMYLMQNSTSQYICTCLLFVWSNESHHMGIQHVSFKCNLHTTPLLPDLLLHLGYLLIPFGPCSRCYLSQHGQNGDASHQGLLGHWCVDEAAITIVLGCFAWLSMSRLYMPLCLVQQALFSPQSPSILLDLMQKLLRI